MRGPRQTTLAALEGRYDAFFLDAYGVLCTHEGPIPGALEAVSTLQEAGKTVLVVTNDASKSPADIAAKFGRMGFSFAPEHIVSSGGLLAAFCAKQRLAGPALILGPPPAVRMAEAAGLVAVTIDAPPARVFVLDEMGYDFLPTVEGALHHVCARLDEPGPHLVVVNPDIIFPQGPDRFGLAAGGIAGLLSSMAAARGVDLRPHTAFLGKPHAPIFEAAVERAGTDNALMIGDQAATDIAGARAFGLDAALVTTGIGRQADDATWLLEDLR